ncbi:DNA-directed RNA polymerase III subunit 2-like [Zingiber officinale]|uniref:DNA-directed RNA polymerase III subunit 2-like n=1 Tax=Zingiber officinale TaxID=94328 RepID=UPI001C4BF699|nr:DNA-directed RNA polymerase III subunit 2-like [Zingiber officinale]
MSTKSKSVSLSLSAPVKSAVDKSQLISEFCTVRGLVKHHVDSYNYFIDHGIKKILQANNFFVCRHDPNFYLRYTNIKVGRPTVEVDHATRMLTPHECRLSDQTYAAPIMVDVEYTIANQATKNPETLAGLVIGRMPIMLRSSHCVLSGKDDDELSKLGECPLDPGGYFIVKGTEKVILIQEQLYKNHIIIDTDAKGRVTASVTSSTHETESKTVFFMDKEKIYLQLNQFNKPIPIMVILKAMGMESDQEIVQMVGRDPQYGDLLFPSIQECASERIYTQQQALNFLDGKIGRSNPTHNGNKKTSLAMAILLDVFLAHVPLYKGNFRPRWIYAAVMLRRMLDAILNTDTFDDKDYLGNKRLELSGQMISWLFEDLFKSMNTRTLELVNREYEKASRSTHMNFIHYIRRNYDITLGLERSISTGNWDLKRFKMHRKGVSQVVSRLSYIAVLGHMTRISPQFEKTRKASGPRALHPSQWGMFCPCDTPEGEGCGLTKNLALLTHITTDEENGPLISLCYTLGVEDLALLSGEELHLPGSFLVMFNGLIIGKHRQPKLFAGNMRKLRRRGKIGEFVSIFVNEVQHCVYIASDGGRVCRPLVIADRGISRIKDYHMKELQLGIRTFDDFLRDGLVEYLDVNEENNALIALHECENNIDDPEKKKGDITHIEIEPLTILGVCAGLIPYPHHNKSLYDTYQCAMGKQAMGNIAYNQLCRADTLLNLLVYPQRPLLTTTTIELVGYDKLGAGQNAIVAVMSYGGYDIGGAIVMNKSSLDRGFGRCIVMKKYSVIKEIYGNQTIDRIVKPRKDEPSMQILDDDGIAAPGEIIRNNDIYVNKKTPINTRKRTDNPTEYRKTPAVYKGPEGETSVVDRVILYSDTSNKLCIKCIIRHTRRPEIGDKFSSRHGQKGVCGAIVQQEDLPFSECGVCPDLIINPHEFISGMTLGKMFELIGGKAGVSCGRFHYGDAFEEPSVHADKVEDISNTLAKHGFSYSGKDFLYSGITGWPLQAYIFMGPIYYQKLKHMVIDKMHARATGPHVLLTRQPTAGRSQDGGLRLGEMERDCLIAHGVSMVIFERLMLSSDPYEVQVCRQCGLFGYYNYKSEIATCSMCKKSGDNMSTVKLPYATKLLIQELQSMNIAPRLKLDEA